MKYLKANEDEYVLMGINLPECDSFCAGPRGEIKMHLLVFVMYSVVIVVFKCPK